MSTIPQSNDDALTWVIDHVAQWTADPEAIGLDASSVTELAALASTAQTRQQTRNNTRDAARGATNSFNSSADAMREFASLQVQRIRTFARGAAEPATVYEDAGIPAPADRSPTPAPGTPEAFQVSLLQNGAIEVTFDCPNPPRVTVANYIVERRLGAQGDFEFLMSALERRFTDATIPLGTSQGAYRGTAQTATRFGNPGQYAVQFGAGNQVTGEPASAESAPPTTDGAGGTGDLKAA